MKVAGKHYRTVWFHDHGDVRVINQTQLPHRFTEISLKRASDAVSAIKDMHIRGAGCIGAVAAWGVYLAVVDAPEEWRPVVKHDAAVIRAARPTASNLTWAVDRMLGKLYACEGQEDACACALREAQAIADEDVACCRAIGQHGLARIRELWERTGKPVNMLTHCNAGWLAFVDYGSATAPIYAAQEAGIPVHVWVDETRPRNQGARLTAWELGQQGIPHTLIADNTGGHLMQHGMVDLVITGTDRVTRAGDVANKIGTYLKALAAADNGIPFYVALPSSTFDFTLSDGVREIPIEERGGDEVRTVCGLNASGVEEDVLICPPATEARNWGFDVTPARLVSGLITERGICAAREDAIRALYPEASY